jgi:hypothetical protein
MLLATAATIDVSVDVLAEAGISELLRRPWSAPSWPPLALRQVRHVTT